MFKNLRFDELNALVQNKRSMPFEQYFGEMNQIQNDICAAAQLSFTKSA